MSKTMKCECGQITGVACAWTGSVEEMTLVEHMPLWLRGTHEAALNRGAYPENGSARLRVSQSCAEDVVDGDWTIDVSN